MNRYLAGKCSSMVSARTFFGPLGVLCLTSVLVISGSFAQENKPSGKEADLQAYVGTWQAKLNDKVFQTIRLENSQGKITGNVSRGNVVLNDDGELVSAEVLEGTDPIVDAKAGLGVLHLTIKPKDKDASNQFEMKLTGANTAELRIVGIPDAEEIKPWTLERVKANK